MTPQPLRERIAEALFNRQEWREVEYAQEEPGCYPGGHYEPVWWGDVSQVDREEYLADADALIEAVGLEKR